MVGWGVCGEVEENQSVGSGKVVLYFLVEACQTILFWVEVVNSVVARRNRILVMTRISA